MDLQNLGYDEDSVENLQMEVSEPPQPRVNLIKKNNRFNRVNLLIQLSVTTGIGTDLGEIDNRLAAWVGLSSLNWIKFKLFKT